MLAGLLKGFFWRFSEPVQHARQQSGHHAIESYGASAVHLGGIYPARASVRLFQSVAKRDATRVNNRLGAEHEGGATAAALTP